MNIPHQSHCLSGRSGLYGFCNAAVCSATAPRAATSTRAPAAAPWLWHFEEKQAKRITPSPQGRWLQVEQGRVWLTESLPRGQASDHWLAGGERLYLPAGSAWVAQGFESARASLLQAPPRFARAFTGLGAAFAWFGFLGGVVLPALAASAACSAQRAQGCIKAGESRASSGAV
jgi:hypothetical protein